MKENLEITMNKKGECQEGDGCMEDRERKNY